MRDPDPAYHSITCFKRCGKATDKTNLYIYNLVKCHTNLLSIRDALGIEKGVDIIHHIRGLPTFTARTDAIAIVRDIERKAMVKQVPQPGLVELMDYLNSKNVKRALCTRNFEYVA